MITGFHTIIYSDDAEVTRAFFRDVLEWPSLDAGGGWLLFKTPPGELGVHPSVSEEGTRWCETPNHQASIMCDDLEATLDDLRSKGVEIVGDVEDQGFGRVSTIVVPAAGTMMLYEPRHPLACELEG